MLLKDMTDKDIDELMRAHVAEVLQRAPPDTLGVLVILVDRMGNVRCGTNLPPSLAHDAARLIGSEIETQKMQELIAGSTDSSPHMSQNRDTCTPPPHTEVCEPELEGAREVPPGSLPP